MNDRAKDPQARKDLAKFLRTIRHRHSVLDKHAAGRQLCRVLLRNFRTSLASGPKFANNGIGGGSGCHLVQKGELMTAYEKAEQSSRIVLATRRALDAAEARDWQAFDRHLEAYQPTPCQSVGVVQDD